MSRSDKPWSAAVAAARANVTYVRVSPRKSPRKHTTVTIRRRGLLLRIRNQMEAQVPTPLRTIVPGSP